MNRHAPEVELACWQRRSSPRTVCLPDRARIGARGFTYVGLMLVIALIALASVAALAAGASLQRRLAEDELLFIGAQFAAAFRSYYEATPVGQRNYPARLDELLRDPRYPGVRRHLRKIYVDPISGHAEWGLVAAPGGVIGVHSLSTQSPLKIAQFEPAFAALADKQSYAEWAFGFLPPGVVPSGNVSLASTLSTIAVPAGAKPSATVPPSPSGPGSPATTPPVPAPPPAR